MKRRYKLKRADDQPEDADKGVVRFTASTDSPDRHDDTIDQAGWVFPKQVPFLWAHDHSIPSLGKVARRTVEDRRLLVDVEFDLDDEFAANIHRKYENDFLAYVSVGFMGLEWSPNDHGGVHFERQELFEVSAVPVPANPDAMHVDRSAEDQEAVHEYAEMALEWSLKTLSGGEQKDGRVLAAEVYRDLRSARELIDGVLAREDRDPDQDADEDAEDGEKSAEDPVVLTLTGEDNESHDETFLTLH